MKLYLIRRAEATFLFAGTGSLTSLRHRFRCLKPIVTELDLNFHGRFIARLWLKVCEETQNSAR